MSMEVEPMISRMETGVEPSDLQQDAKSDVDVGPDAIQQIMDTTLNIPLNSESPHVSINNCFSLKCQ